MRFLSRSEDVAMVLLLWALFLVVGLQFFTRYILNDSLGWTEEIARMLLIVMTYSGAVVCARTSGHIQVDLIIASMPDRAQTLLGQLYKLISAAFFIFLAWTAVQFALRTRLMMSSIEIPKSIIYWFCAVALALMALHYVILLFSANKTVEQEVT